MAPGEDSQDEVFTYASREILEGSTAQFDTFVPIGIDPTRVIGMVIITSGWCNFNTWHRNRQKWVTVMHEKCKK